MLHGPQTIPVARVPEGTAAGAPESRAGLQGGVEVQVVGLSPIAPPPSQQTVPGRQASSSRDVTSRQVPTPPGLSFLGREPPSAARSWGPRKEVPDLASLRQVPKGVSSEERSAYFAEYRQGRVPGSPGLDQLRASANLGDAPS